MQDLTRSFVRSDGWASLVDDEVNVDRSLPALVNALRELGVPDTEATRLAQQTFEAWEAVPRPPDRTRRAPWRMNLKLFGQILALSAWLVGRLARLAGREAVRAARGEPRDRSPPSVLLGTGEYGLVRVIASSVGWVELEFWAEWNGQVGIYGADGWFVPRKEMFEVSEEGAVPALMALGVPEPEAEKIAALVVDERLGRIAAVTS